MSTTFTYLGFQYQVLNETDEYVEVTQIPRKDESYLQIRKGSPRYVQIFGGELKNIVGNAADTVFIKPQIQLIRDRSTAEDEMYGSGYIVKLVDSVCDASNKAEKTKLIKDAIDNNPEKQAGIYLMLLCHRYRKETKLYSDDILSMLPNVENTHGDYEDEFWADIIMQFKSLFINEKEAIIRENVQELLTMIVAEDRKFFAYALARWEGMAHIGLSNKEIENILGV